jgi:fatty acid/phospholipid biosynthesis enzyme
MTSVAAMMLAADRIAPIVLAASPELRDALYRKYFGVSEEWLRSHGSAEAEEAKATLDWGEQIARRLVAMRLANETPAQEEQRA